MSIEDEIIKLIFDNHSSRRYCFFGPWKEINLDTELTRIGPDGLSVIWEDAQDTLSYYFEHWNVELNGFDITHYFNPDFLGSKPPKKPLKPLYVWMLVESAKAGRWLYD